MADFVTRVELHGANSEDYERLHGEMRVRFFKRTIDADDGTTYHLPSAMYSYSDDVTAEFVREKAKEAASAIGKSCWVITCGGKMSWYLPPA
ncbi:hypothetical protein [Burkholderia gladioli]|uniref:hypothetical protein n=1 Tax=Burkholderia gladioli TaxID=28095 RepID=UPI0034DB09BA